MTDNLAAKIEKERDAAREFLSLLKKEQAALVSGDTESLASLVEAKSGLVRKIAELVNERKRLMGSSMAKWIESHPESKKTWEEMLRLSEEIKETNAINGSMIDTRLRSSQQALSMLQTLANKATSLYGPDGQSSPLSRGRSINSA